MSFWLYFAWTIMCNEKCITFLNILTDDLKTHINKTRKEILFRFFPEQILIALSFVCSLGRKGWYFDIPPPSIFSLVVSITILATIAPIASIIGLPLRKLSDLDSDLIHNRDSILLNALLYAKQPSQIQNILFCNVDAGIKVLKLLVVTMAISFRWLVLFIWWWSFCFLFFSFYFYVVFQYNLSISL